MNAKMILAPALALSTMSLGACAENYSAEGGLGGAAIGAGIAAVTGGDITRYDYSLKPGWPLKRYGIEQQAEIVKHAFWLRNGVKLAGAPDVSAYDMLVRFPGATTRG